MKAILNIPYSSANSQTISDVDINLTKKLGDKFVNFISKMSADFESFEGTFLIQALPQDCGK